MRDFNKDLEDGGPYILLHPDASEIIKVPVTEKPFVPEEGKVKAGKAHSMAIFFSLCTKKKGFEKG